MNIAEITKKMIDYSDGNLHDICHFLKVYAYAKTIGECEKLDSRTQFTLETAALMHDIACPLCRAKYGNTNGKYQEKEWDLTVSHRPQIGGKQVVEDICRESDADSHDIRVGILKDI